MERSRCSSALKPGAASSTAALSALRARAQASAFSPCTSSSQRKGSAGAGAAGAGGGGAVGGGAASAGAAVVSTARERAARVSRRMEVSWEARAGHHSRRQP